MDTENSGEFSIPPNIDNKDLASKLDELADKLSEVEADELSEVASYMREASRRIGALDQPSGNIVAEESQKRELRSQKEKDTDKETESLRQGFRDSTTKAGYNIFQLVNCQMQRDDGELKPSSEPIYGPAANSWRGIDGYIKKVAGYEVEKRVKNRRKQLIGMQLGDRANEGDPRKYRVGNSALVVSENKNGNTQLIIYGCISSEVMGTWKGGRTNCFNSIWFEVDDKSLAQEFIDRVDLNARGYDDGTENNYKVIYEAISGVFPKQTVKCAKSYMFHRQEITEVIDLREKQTL